MLKSQLIQPRSFSPRAGTSVRRRSAAVASIGSIILSAFGVVSAAQQPPESLAITGLRSAEQRAPVEPASGTDPGYILGPGDQINVRVVNLEEINDKPIPIDLSGSIRLPLIGRFQVSGLTVAAAESELARRLGTYMRHPDVTVSIAEFRSQPVSVIGAVKNPGVQQVQGRKTLVEMLSLVGGLDTAAAGATVKITRRLEWGRIPLPHAADDPTGQFSIAEVRVKSLLEAKNPEENILVKPYDVISVPRADMVYVMGQVTKAGGFALNDADGITVLQAISLAGGLDRTAKPQDAKILRRVPGASSKTEVAVNLKKVLNGQTPDVQMQPEDILFVPNNTPKNASMRAIEAIIQAGTIAVWRFP
jgi:polysaccharide export outer membrane protein